MGSSGEAGPPAHMGINFTSKLHHDTYPTIDSATASSGIEGKHVFITGASKGIGKSIGASFAKAGAAVIGIAARSELEEAKKEIEDAAVAVNRPIPKVVTTQMDVSSWESIQSAVQKITTDFNGRLDILIGGAGYMETWRPIGEVDIIDWWRSFEINIKGQLMVWKAMLPLLLADDSSLKTIVNLSSIGAQMTSPGASAYQTGKLALIRMTEFLNVDHGEQGLIAYCMHPGSVPTELATKMPDAVHSKLIDTPELMADTVVFLTQKRRDWLRGRYISCNWDMDEFLGMKDEIVRDDKLKIKMVV